MKKLITLALCMAFLAVTSMAFAEQVFVTKQGVKYHKADCRLIQNKETKAISEEEAIEQGYKPCGRCLKEKTQSADESSQTKSSEKKSKKK